jgi:class 3 adenylate cyclase/tetratricopeptide (TPR) repeat protein
LVEGARFCASCGTPLQRRSDERRVVTVLFADLVGFTSLSETRDPEHVKNIVDDSFERLVADIEAYGGQVDKIVGDAILALFGAPVAHEDDAERAVRAALTMQRTLTDCEAAAGTAGLQMRIGINTGEVLVGALRAGGDYTAMGDVVNSAQRLQTTAQPGQIVVGSATHTATRHVVRFTELGPVNARGRDEPIHAWVAEEALLPPGARPGRGNTPMVGRDHELGLLTRAIDTAFERRRAQLLLVVAEAGMGKTRLAEEVAAIAECDHGVAVLEGRCVPYGEANVWWPVAEALRSTCEVNVGDPMEVARPLVTARTALGLPSETAAEVERVTDGLLHIMGYEDSLGRIDPARAREEVRRSLLTFIDGFARQHPVVVLLSDLHWADDVVLELIDQLLERLAALPVVLIGTARTDLFERWRPAVGRHNQLVLNLDPLSREATAMLLEALAEGPVPEDLRTVLLDRSGGNPFFLEELVSLLAETNMATDDDISVAPATGTRELPHTLRGLVAARLDSLTVDERCTLEDAAVLGRRGAVVALQIMGSEAHGTSTPAVDAAIAGLEAKDLLVLDDGRWSFRSDLVREVAYGMLTKADRARRHYGVAKWMESHAVTSPADVDRIAHHYATAATLVDELGFVADMPDEIQERALTWLDRAIHQAEAGELYPVVVHLCTHGLKLRRIPREHREHFLLARGRARINIRELEQAAADVDAAMESAAEAGDDASRAAALTARGDLEQKAGDLERSLSTLQEAVELYRAVGDEQGVAESLRAYGMTRMFADDGVGATASFLEALDLYRTLGDRRGEAWALQNLAWVAYTGGDASKAEEWLNESVEAFTEIRDSGGLGWATGLLAFVRYHQGRHAEAEAMAERLYIEAGQRGDRWAEGMMRNLLAMLGLWGGRAAESVPHGEAAYKLFTQMRDWYGEMIAAGVLGRALLAVGRIDDGFTVLDESIHRASELPLDHAAEVADAQLACAAAQAGMPDRGRMAPPITDEPVHEIGWVDWHVASALQDLQRGSVAEARARLERLVAGDEPNGYAASALALVLAADGDAAASRVLSLKVAGLESATYSDRIMAMLGGGLGQARIGEEEVAEAWLRTARELADGTEDRLLAAIVRVAEARAGQKLGHVDADASLQRAQLGLEAMGVNEPGWDTAFRLAAGLP